MREETEMRDKHMAEEYLDSLKKTANRKKRELQKEKENLERQIRENKRQSDQIKPDKNANYDLFTPRSAKPDQKEKKKQLAKEMEALAKRQEELEQQISDNRRNIADIRELELKFREVRSAEERAQQKENDKVEDEEKIDLQNILRRIELCYKLIDIDPVRCKLEMSEVMEYIQNQMEVYSDGEL